MKKENINKLSKLLRTYLMCWAIALSAGACNQVNKTPNPIVKDEGLSDKVDFEFNEDGNVILRISDTKYSDLSYKIFSIINGDEQDLYKEAKVNTPIKIEEDGQYVAVIYHNGKREYNSNIFQVEKNNKIESTPVPSVTPTPTTIPSPTNTPVPTNIPTNTPTLTPTAIPTVTPTPTIVPTKAPTNTPTPTPTETPGEWDYAYIENFNILDQNDFPTGCESVSTVMVLNYLGFDITKAEFIGKYLKTIPTIEEFYEIEGNEYKNVFDYYFVGDPKTIYGRKCSAKAIKKFVDAYFDDIGETDCICIDYTDHQFEDLVEELKNGNPVIIWVTDNFQQSNNSYDVGKIHTEKKHSHTCVLYGIDEKKNIAYIANSLNVGKTTYKLDAVEYLYKDMGSRAVVIKQKQNEMNIDNNQENEKTRSR